MSGIQWVYQLFNITATGWNKDLLQKLFEPIQVAAILSIPIDSQHPDSLVWPLTSSSRFTTKSTDTKLCQDDTLQVQPLPINAGYWLSLWELSFHTICSSNLRRFCIIFPQYGRGSNISYMCPAHTVFCLMCYHQQVEDLDHVFVPCQYSKVIWTTTYPSIFPNFSSTLP